MPCKYFYDDCGSRLFEEICQLDEYYFSRTELSIMEQFGPQFAEQIGPGATLIEYGSGSSLKTRIRLDHLKSPVAYVPVDVSREQLLRTADQLAESYGGFIEVLPVCADFTADFAMPSLRWPMSSRVVYFPGSTIGNSPPHTATALLADIAKRCGSKGGLLIGIDLQKDEETVRAAYNDARGVTAAFNLNLLRRINRELNADFSLDQFEHLALYNSPLSRVEIYLVSRHDQTVAIDDHAFKFTGGEQICTEYSYKYTVGGFRHLAAAAGLTLRRCWTDARRWFSMLYFDKTT